VINSGKGSPAWPRRPAEPALADLNYHPPQTLSLALKVLVKMTKNALLLVDIQYDFISGTLAVPGAQEILAPTYSLLDDHKWDLVIASQASQIRSKHMLDNSTRTS
jgi:hypothetical protein